MQRDESKARRGRAAAKRREKEESDVIDLTREDDLVIKENHVERPYTTYRKEDSEPPKKRARSQPGRPMKYAAVIWALDREKLYSPSMLADLAIEQQLVEGLNYDDELDVRLVRQRIRITMGRFSNNHEFPDLGDGMVRVYGQAPTPAWLGARWQDAAR